MSITTSDNCQEFIDSLLYVSNFTLHMLMGHKLDTLLHKTAVYKLMNHVAK